MAKLSDETLITALELLTKAIEQAHGNLASSVATIQESKRDTGLL